MTHWRFGLILAAVTALGACQPIGGTMGAQIDSNPENNRLDDVGYSKSAPGYNQILNVPPYGQQ